MFLFKHKIKYKRNTKDMYLHYSMFLFKLNSEYIYIESGKNLHYSMFLFKRKKFGETTYNPDIYITVCFYLNALFTTLAKAFSAFTLQYVSI